MRGKVGHVRNSRNSTEISMGKTSQRKGYINSSKKKKKRKKTNQFDWFTLNQMLSKTDTYRRLNLDAKNS